jgi:hypothetical protein
MISTDEELLQINRKVVGLYQNKQYLEANELAIKAFEFGKKFLGIKHPLTVTSKNNLRIMKDKVGDHAFA